MQDYPTEIPTTQAAPARPRRPRPSRKVKGSTLTTYNWAQVPRQLLEDAQAKCRAQEPPISLKWQLIKLLKAWTYEERDV